MILLARRVGHEPSTTMCITSALVIGLIGGRAGLLSDALPKLQGLNPPLPPVITTDSRLPAIVSAWCNDSDSNDVILSLCRTSITPTDFASDVSVGACIIMVPTFLIAKGKFLEAQEWLNHLLHVPSASDGIDSDSKPASLPLTGGKIGKGPVWKTVALLLRCRALMNCRGGLNSL